MPIHNLNWLSRNLPFGTYAKRKIGPKSSEWSKMVIFRVKYYRFQWNFTIFHGRYPSTSCSKIFHRIECNLLHKWQIDHLGEGEKIPNRCHASCEGMELVWFDRWPSIKKRRSFDLKSRSRWSTIWMFLMSINGSQTRPEIFLTAQPRNKTKSLPRKIGAPLAYVGKSGILTVWFGGLSNNFILVTLMSLNYLESINAFGTKSEILSSSWQQSIK